MKMQKYIIKSTEYMAYGLFIIAILCGSYKGMAAGVMLFAISLMLMIVFTKSRPSKYGYAMPMPHLNTEQSLDMDNRDEKKGDVVVPLIILFVSSSIFIVFVVPMLRDMMAR